MRLIGIAERALEAMRRRVQSRVAFGKPISEQGTIRADIADSTVRSAMAALIKSGEFEALYKKWFQSPIPPKGINLNLPMPEVFKHVVASPTDSPDPTVYK